MDHNKTPGRMQSCLETENQSLPLTNYNLFQTDQVLIDCIKRSGADWAQPKLTDFGEKMGSLEFIQYGFEANENPPNLHSHSRTGGRLDFVEFHPSWHKIIGESIANGVHCSSWKEPKKGAHVARSAMFFLAYQNESGHCCPMAMTYGSVPALKAQPNLLKEWEPKLFSYQYDPAFKPVDKKAGALVGMAMTEKQGGSDVRTNTTQAEPIRKRGPGEEYLITGHKWFCSAPMCDAFLVLAQTPPGLSCFFLPRFTPDGKPNQFFIQRLKNKLGDKSNASSEIELKGAWARLIGEEGRGVPIIIEMANSTRLDCTLAAAALMRQGILQAIHHCFNRHTFGHQLSHHSLMKNVLADLCLESEATTLFAMRLAQAFDCRDSESTEIPFRRLATAIGKYYLTKRSIHVVSETLEVLGGNGYVEDFILARMYRQAPLNSVWEGSGNVICLDVLRTINREKQALEAFFKEVNQATGRDNFFDTFVKSLEADLKKAKDLETLARHFTERMALALQASLLLRFSSPEIAHAFCASRLAQAGYYNFGTLSLELKPDNVIHRSWSGQQ